MSVCSLDKLASIDIPAGKNSGIFGLLAESVTETAPVLWVKVRVRAWSSDRIQSIAEFNIATWDWACGFFFRTQLPHHLRYLAPRSKPWNASIAPQKILAFLLGTLSFYPYKFSGTEPSNFCVRGVELLFRLVLHSGCQTWQLHGKFSPFWMRICCLKCNSIGSKHQTGRIGSCKDLSDCSLSHQKWKLFSIVCQELGKLCQLSLTIGTRVWIC